MIEVTLVNGTKKFINPKHIVSVESQQNGISLIYTTIDLSQVNESVEEIVKMMRHYLMPIVYVPNDNNLAKDNFWK